MKKYISILVFLMCAVLLSSCDPITCHLYKDTYLDKIERIELVKYNNDNYEMVDASKEELKYDPSKAELLEVLHPEKFDEFLSDFEKITFFVGWSDSVNEPTGYCMLWYLKNGNYIVISSTIKNKRA